MSRSLALRVEIRSCCRRVRSKRKVPLGRNSGVVIVSAPRKAVRMEVYLGITGAR